MNKTMAGMALAAIVLAFGAQAQDAREGPIEIDKCQTISQPGSYKLVNNLTFSARSGACLSITANFVSIDLAGFSINGPGEGFPTAIEAGDSTSGIAIRNGSIVRFFAAVALSGSNSVVEGLRITGCPRVCFFGISAAGIVKGNIVSEVFGTGIFATGIITANYVSNTAEGGFGFSIGKGSTVIGNIANSNFRSGFSVDCPSNVTDNTAVNSLFGPNLALNGTGCNNTNNVAP